jgi:hypothetical protein
MRAFLNDHQNTIAAIGATTSVGASAASFFSAVNPILQFVSLLIGIIAGLLTILHFFRQK